MRVIEFKYLTRNDLFDKKYNSNLNFIHAVDSLTNEFDPNMHNANSVSIHNFCG